MDIAGQLISYEDLFLIAYDDPDAIHFLLEKINKAFVMLWKAQKKIAEDKFLPSHLAIHSWIPEEVGCTLSADSLVMFGEDFYKEFYEPVLENLAETLGTIFIHSCGQWPQLLKPISEADYISAINPAQMNIKSVLAAGFNKEKILFMNLSNDEIEKELKLIRENNLYVLSKCNFSFPQDEKGIKHPREWSKEEYNDLLEREKKVIEALTI